MGYFPSSFLFPSCFLPSLGPNLNPLNLPPPAPPFANFQKSGWGARGGKERNASHFPASLTMKKRGPPPLMDVVLNPLGSVHTHILLGAREGCWLPNRRAGILRLCLLLRVNVGVTWENTTRLPFVFLTIRVVSERGQSILCAEHVVLTLWS